MEVARHKTVVEFSLDDDVQGHGQGVAHDRTTHHRVTHTRKGERTTLTNSIQFYMNCGQAWKVVPCLNATHTLQPESCVTPHKEKGRGWLSKPTPQQAHITNELGVDEPFSSPF